jgi:hypothetical protein
MALIALTGFAQKRQTGDVMYVYQKDGNIRTFLRSEITEFYYGFEDEDGVTHDGLQMQWIVLEDSICKIPLANIDSISFVTPPTVFQPAWCSTSVGVCALMAAGSISAAIIRTSNFFISLFLF